MTLAYKNAIGNKQIARVPDLRYHTQRRPANAPDSRYDFTAAAALDSSGHFLVGREVKKTDPHFPLKTMLLYCAGIVRRDVLLNCPDGQTLAASIAQKGLKRLHLVDALRRHLVDLRDSSLRQAEACEVEIRKMCATYPNYTCPDEASGNHDLCEQPI